MGKRSELGFLLLICGAGFLVDGNRTSVGAVAEEDDLYGNIVTRKLSSKAFQDFRIRTNVLPVSS